MDAVILNFWSVALLGVAGTAYTHRARALAMAAVLLFIPVAISATWTVYGDGNPTIAWTIALIGTGPGLLGYALYGIDAKFACFTTEMTYATLPASILWPAVVLANCIGQVL